MKKLLPIISFVILASTGILGQDFGKNNAFWTYDYLANFSFGEVQLQFQKDTIFEEKNVTFYQLAADLTTPFGDPIKYIKKNVIVLTQEEGIVYIYTGYPNYVFDTLYNFNAIAGDTWALDKVTCHVLSVDTIKMSGFNRKRLAVEYQFNEWSRPIATMDIIVEGIGNTTHFLDIRDYFLSFVDGNVGGDLICFKDDFLTYGTPCSYFYLNNRQIDKDISIYPNPSTDILKVQCPDCQKFLIKDLRGNILLEGELITSQEIVVSSLNPGAYIIYLSNKNGDIMVKKFIVR